jgi:ribonuclease HI
MPSKLPPSRLGRLFAEPEKTAATGAAAHIAQIDGAARGNPGPASYGVVIRAPGGALVAELKKYIGTGTNNVAEYYALIAALDYAISHSIGALRIRSDSELLVRQMQGRYKVKSPDLRPLYERARKMSQGLASFAIEHVGREQNSEADALANQALDSTGRRSPDAGLAASTSPIEAETGAPSTGEAGCRQPDHAKALAREVRRQTQRIRARYSGGVLIPTKPIDLSENTEVELTIMLLPTSAPAKDTEGG